MKDHFWQLVMRKISGNSNSSDEEALQSLLSGDAHSDREYQQLKKIWRSSGMKHEVKTLNSDDEWLRLKTKLHKVSARDKGIIIRLANSWVGVAAALTLLMVSVYMVIGTYNVPVNVPVDHSLVRITASDSVKSLYLPDSSRVWLNIHSQLSYSSEFGKDHRDITLNGEAYFEVRRDTTRKFSISTGRVVVSVLGTSFNVKSHLSSDKIEVSVSSGKVAVRDSSQMVLLSANEKAVYSNEKRSLKKSRIQNQKYLNWRKSTDAIYHDEVTHFRHYVSHEYNWKKNDINLTKIGGTIVNNATLAIYQSVKFKATYYTKNGGRKASTYFTIDGPVRPGERLKYKKILLFDWLSNTSNIKIEMQQVEIEKTDH